MGKPEIRFKEFTDDWEQRKLGEIGEVITGSTPSTQHPEYYSEDGMPWVTPTDIVDNIIYDTPRKLSPIGEKVGRVVPADTILVTCIASIGKNAMLVNTGSFNQQINGLVPDKKKYDPYFLLTESFHWSAKMKREAAAGTMQIVNKNEFSAIETYVPELSEQKVIGAYFCQIDKLITLHQRKCDEVKTLKKYMLQKMFPQNGMNIPEIRFSGFTDVWEQRKLGEVAIYRRGSFPQPYGKSEWYDGEEAKPFVQVADVTDAMNLVDDTKQKISKLAQPMSVFAEKGSVLVTLQGSIGRVAITQYGAFVDRTVLIFEKYKTEIDNLFWAYVIKQKFIEEARKAPGGTIKTITKEALSDFDLLLPNYNEQQQIGSFFKQLDNLITLHQRKCDELRKMKKFMLQNMFPKE